MLEYYSLVREGTTNHTATMAMLAYLGTRGQEAAEFFKTYSVRLYLSFPLLRGDAWIYAYRANMCRTNSSQRNARWQENQPARAHLGGRRRPHGARLRLWARVWVGRRRLREIVPRLRRDGRWRRRGSEGSCLVAGDAITYRVNSRSCGRPQSMEMFVILRYGAMI